MDEVVLALILLHGQLQLADRLAYLYLQHYILSLRLRQSVVQLENVVAIQEAQLITSLYRSLQISNSVEHDFAS